MFFFVFFFLSILHKIVCTKKRDSGPHPNIQTLSPGIGISIIEMRRSANLIFIMGIPVLVKKYLYWDNPLFFCDNIDDGTTKLLTLVLYLQIYLFNHLSYLIFFPFMKFFLWMFWYTPDQSNRMDIFKISDYCYWLNLFVLEHCCIKIKLNGFYSLSIKVCWCT